MHAVRSKDSNPQLTFTCIQPFNEFGAVQYIVFNWPDGLGILSHTMIACIDVAEAAPMLSCRKLTCNALGILSSPACVAKSC